jgi:hypothetical protein
MEADCAIENEGKPAGSAGSAGSINTINRQRRQLRRQLRKIYAGRRAPSRLWGAVEAVGECHGARPFNTCQQQKRPYKIKQR